MNLVDYLFGLNLIFELLLGVGLLISFVYSKHRLWPPPKKGSWKYWYIHLSTESSILCFLVLCFFNWNTFFFSNWIWLIFGLFLMILGLFFFLMGIKDFELKNILGIRKQINHIWSI